MKKMATILAILLITVLALSPIACNSGGEETPETPPAGRPSPAPTPTSTQNAPATPVDVIEHVENDPPITIPTVALDEEQPTAVLAIDSLIVTPELVLPGEETMVEAVITNVGDATGPCPAILKVDGIESDSCSLNLAPGASETVSFNLARDLYGEYDISVGDKSATLSVAQVTEYHNETMNYSILYPSEWTLDDTIPEIVSMIKTGIGGICVTAETATVEMSQKEYYLLGIDSLKNEISSFNVISKEEILENESVAGYNFSFTMNTSGANSKGHGIVMKKGRYGFNAIWFVREAVYELHQPTLDACLDSFVPPEVAIGSYTNTTHGFSLTLPSRWDGFNTGDITPLLTILSGAGEQPVVAELFVEPLYEPVEAREKAEELRDALGEQITIQTKSEGPKSLGPDTEGYEIIFDYTYKGTSIRNNVTSVVRGTQSFTFLIRTLTSSYIATQSQIDRLIRSFTLIEPTPFGVSRQNSLFFWEGDILTLDPAKAEEGPSGIVGAIFSGLVRTGKDLDVIPDIAERWEISEDGTVYTFYLKDEVTFHDGQQVTAQDFKYSWERACNPDTESRTARTYLGDIIGAKEMLDGKATELSGVRAIDDLTLEVTIDGPKPHFLGKLVFVTSHVVDRANAERGMNWTDSPNGTGPFKLKEWQKDELLILERNPDYYYAPIDIEHVVYQIYAGMPMMMYEQGEIDVTSVSISNMDRVLDITDPLNQDLISETMIGMDYLGFNVTMPPFDDPKIREAFALALDMDKILEVSMKGRAERAAGYIPDGMTGYNSTLEPLPFDPDLAKQLVAESKYGSVDNLPPITFYAVYGLGPSAEAMIGMWQANLGITVEAEAVEELEDWRERMYNREYQLFSSGWYPDYYDPQNYLEILFHSQSDMNHFAYSNPDVDAALEKAAIEQDEDMRLSMYQDIEQQILTDLPAVPFYQNYTVYLLIKPYIDGYFISLIDMKFWEDLSIQPH